jgi:ribosomal protein S12 methylthiotransferase
MATAHTRVSFTTLGCPKNEADSDHMKALVRDAGYLIVDSPDEADVAVVNTCAFLTEASEESIDTIFDILMDDAHLDGRPPKVVVTGCLPSRYGKDLEDEMGEVCAFLSCADESSIVDVISRLSDSLPKACSTSKDPVRCDHGPSAYVKISDGCDRYCSFCTIPFIRGRYASRPASEIVAEIGILVGSGVREVVLVGQDTGIWGHDLPGAPVLTDLLEQLASSYPDTWFRVLYIQPEGITDRLLELMATTDNLCPYLDIPLQHVSSRILSEMNRSGSAGEFSQLVARIRERVPDVRLRTTFICGFPGETQEDFEELCDFVREAGFDYAGVFPYSQEEGTVAGDRADQVDPDERIDRANELRRICDQTGFAKTARHVGEEAWVLFEGHEHTDSGQEAVGRTMGQAPEIDGGVHVPDADLTPGTIARVRLVDSFCYEYEGECIR